MLKINKYINKSFVKQAGKWPNCRKRRRQKQQRTRENNKTADKKWE